MIYKDDFGDKGRMGTPIRMNFQKSSKGGGEVIFNPKIYVADLDL